MVPTTKGGYRGVGVLRHGLLGGQAAASMVPPLAAGLANAAGLVQSLTIHPGFETSNISVVDLDLQEAG